MPAIGAVLVPINYRLIADDFAYIINHSGAQRGLRARRLPGSLDGIRERAARCASTLSRWKGRAMAGWTTRRCSPRRDADFARPEIDENDLLTINYTSGTTSRPERRDDHPSQRLS